MGQNVMHTNDKKVECTREKGVFVSYDKNSLAHLVFYSDTGKVLKNRLVNFVTKSTNERDNQTDEDKYENPEQRKRV